MVDSVARLRTAMLCLCAAFLVHSREIRRVGEIHDTAYTVSNLPDALSLGGNFETNLVKAFRGRHLAFIGDSTTYSMYSEVASFLYASLDQERLVRVATEVGLSRVTNGKMNAAQQKEDKEEASRRLALARLFTANKTTEAHAALTESCPDPDLLPPNRCQPLFGSLEGTKQFKSISIRVPSARRHDNCGDSLTAATATDAANAMPVGDTVGGPARLLARDDFALSVFKGQGCLPAADAVAKLKILEKQQGGQRADIVVVTGGLHYLHLWPAVPFETDVLLPLDDRSGKVKTNKFGGKSDGGLELGTAAVEAVVAADTATGVKDSSGGGGGGGEEAQLQKLAFFDAAAMLTNYSRHLGETLLALRRHVGAGGLVILKTTNDVCEDAYFSVWSKLAEVYKRGPPPPTKKVTAGARERSRAIFDLNGTKTTEGAAEREPGPGLYSYFWEPRKVKKSKKKKKSLLPASMLAGMPAPALRVSTLATLASCERYVSEQLGVGASAKLVRGLVSEELAARGEGGRGMKKGEGGKGGEVVKHAEETEVDVRLGCVNTMLSHSGVATLNAIAVPVLEEEGASMLSSTPGGTKDRSSGFGGSDSSSSSSSSFSSDGGGLAALRVVDAYALTRNRCELTKKGDGRHYFALDLSLLEMVARASLEEVVAHGKRPVDRSEDWKARAHAYMPQ